MDDAMTTVFSYLSPRLCSRRLKRVAFRVSAVNEKYSIFSSEHHLTKPVVDALAATATALQSVVIDRMIVTIGAVEAFCQLPPTLEGRGWTFDHFVLDETLLQLLPSTLRDLSISAGGSLKITNLHFLRGKMLESLAIQRSFISSADLAVLVDMAATLTTLDLTSCINISDGTLLSKLYSLRSLYLGNNRELSDETVLGVCAGCPRLQRLSLDNCAMLSPMSLLGLEFVQVNVVKVQSIGSWERILFRKDVHTR
ncbi:unnamed protein product [Heligmosomoides polygyrus]|uniref:F-box domain-containing protein n=1 Tax=Heligmosomoides polygyrus TaxID=6339 RepID=A0A3P8C8M3_HELPZ|nr:unnamed protein product [Heligmosomoides polygyrus]